MVDQTSASTFGMMADLTTISVPKKDNLSGGRIGSPLSDWVANTLQRSLSVLHRWSRSALTVSLDNSNPHASLASDMQAADLGTKRVRAAEQRRMSCFDEYIQCHRCDKRQSRLDIIAQEDL
ncbi:hypothetical protein [Bradyrhizobium sp. CW7]|uniref:hypothetical protein n=2 Tax=Bradyrhizobium TaxID=374 RepID=UPI001FFC1E37|nr:hypothetical protein [Bradyrhizobium sp. CW7]